MTDSQFPVLAHGVGRVYELPIPLALYLAAAAATVLVSFFIRAFVAGAPVPSSPRRVAGPGAARVVAAGLQAAGIIGLVLAVVSGVVSRAEGFTLTTLLFWVGLVVGMLIVNSVVAGAWEAADPWGTLERAYRLEDAELDRPQAPWWFVPIGLYLLFWFELVSGVGFVDFWIVIALLMYSLFSFSYRARLGDQWSAADPLSVLFGWAGRVAPLRLEPTGIYRKGVVDDLDEPSAMPVGLFAALFLLLASTTFDNVSETVGWSSFLSSTNLDSLPAMLVESLALLAFALLFFVPYALSVGIARVWGANGRGLPRGCTPLWLVFDPHRDCICPRAQRPARDLRNTSIDSTAVGPARHGMERIGDGQSVRRLQRVPKACVVR
jgi:hypothetical protein